MTAKSLRSFCLDVREQRYLETSQPFVEKVFSNIYLHSQTHLEKKVMPLQEVRIFRGKGSYWKKINDNIVEKVKTTIFGREMEPLGRKYEDTRSNSGSQYCHFEQFTKALLHYYIGCLPIETLRFFPIQQFLTFDFRNIFLLLFHSKK